MSQDEIEVLRAKLESLPPEERAAKKAAIRDAFAQVDEDARLAKIAEARAARVAIADAYLAAGRELAAAALSRPARQLAPFVQEFKLAHQRIDSRGIDPALLAHTLPGQIARLDWEGFTAEVERAHAAALEIARAK